MDILSVMNIRICAQMARRNETCDGVAKTRIWGIIYTYNSTLITGVEQDGVRRSGCASGFISVLDI